jgi:hypothetical protein
MRLLFRKILGESEGKIAQDTAAREIQSAFDAVPSVALAVSQFE